MSSKDAEETFHVLVKAKNGKKTMSVAKETTFAAAEAVFKARKENGQESGRLFLTRCVLGGHTILAKA